MSQQLAGYTLIQQMAEELKLAADHLQNVFVKYQEARRLLQIDETINTQGMTASSQLFSTAPVQGQQGCSWKLALWHGANSYSGTLEVADMSTGKKLNARVILFNSKPNDKNMVLNGSVIPENSEKGASLSDISIGGCFVYRNADGSMNVSGFLDATEVTNRLDFKAPLSPNSSDNPKAPQARAEGTIQVSMLTEQGMHTLGITPSAPPVQQPPVVPFQTDLLTSSSSPADPVTPTTPEGLFGTTAAPEAQDLLGGQQVQSITDLLS